MSQGTQHLADAAKAAGVGHLLYVSIVGIEHIPIAYYRRKLSCEQWLAGSGTGHTIFRATQFHELMKGLLRTVERWPLAPPAVGVSLPAAGGGGGGSPRGRVARRWRAGQGGRHGRSAGLDTRRDGPGLACGARRTPARRRRAAARLRGEWLSPRFEHVPRACRRPAYMGRACCGHCRRE